MTSLPSDYPLLADAEVTFTGIALAGLPGPDALAVREGRIAWIGSAADAGSTGLPVLDLADRFGGQVLVAPAFVDSHAHLLPTGRQLAGVELGAVGSVAQLLEVLAARVRRLVPGDLLTGGGWDHTGWPEGRPATRTELDRVAPGHPVWLTRVEYHSGLASSALIDRVPGIRAAEGFSDDGWLKREAYALATHAANELWTESQSRDHVHAALDHALAQGYGTVHEMSAPHVSSPAELELTRALAADRGFRVHACWGELATPDNLAWAREVGLLCLGGDLNLDGAIGSRTAALHRPYADENQTGFAFLDVETAARHVVDTARAGLQAGFHCIGEKGVGTGAAAMKVAATAIGPELFRSQRHRLEHVEMCSDESAAVLAEYGVWASMQPMFDRWWGGPGELYEERLGADRAAGLNRFATLRDAGVRLAFGSDSPVTPFLAWEGVRAAVRPWGPKRGVSIAEAVAAYSIAGHRLAGDLDRGRLRAGAGADLSLWRCEDLVDGWPALEPAGALPTCVGTIVAGRVLHDPTGLIGTQGQPAGG